MGNHLNIVRDIGGAVGREAKVLANLVDGRVLLLNRCGNDNSEVGNT